MKQLPAVLTLHVIAGAAAAVFTADVLVASRRLVVYQVLVDQARAQYSVITLDSDDWSKNATALEEILRVGNLKSNFESYIVNIKAANK